MSDIATILEAANTIEKLQQQLEQLKHRCRQLDADLTWALEQITAKDAALIEREAELIYLRLYGRDGAKWSANDSKDVWREKARAALSQPASAQKET